MENDLRTCRRLEPMRLVCGVQGRRNSLLSASWWPSSFHWPLSRSIPLRTACPGERGRCPPTAGAGLPQEKAARRHPSGVEESAWAWPADSFRHHQLWRVKELHSLRKGHVVLKCFITKLLLKNAQHVNSNWNDKR